MSVVEKQEIPLRSGIDRGFELRSGQTKDYKKTLEKTKGEIKNGQSRDTGNIEYTRHMMKGNKAKNIT
jgi:hypothetical protein